MQTRCNINLTQVIITLLGFRFFFSLNSHEGPISESARGFWWCHDKIYQIPPLAADWQLFCYTPPLPVC